MHVWCVHYLVRLVESCVSTLQRCEYVHHYGLAGHGWPRAKYIPTVLAGSGVCTPDKGGVGGEAVLARVC